MSGQARRMVHPSINYIPTSVAVARVAHEEVQGIEGRGGSAEAEETPMPRRDPEVFRFHDDDQYDIE